MKRFFILLVVFVLPAIVFGQDSSLLLLKKRIEVDIAGNGLWHSKLPGDTKPIQTPGYLIQKRKLYNPNFNKKWQHAEDNPLFHAAYQMHVNSRLDVGKGFWVYASLITEHRGFSYGINSTENILIFPQMKIAVDRKIRIGKRDLHLLGSVGNQINPRLYEGLMIYNMYKHGHNYRFRYGKIQLHYVQINDLLNGIGLNTDESYDVIGSLEELIISDKWRLDLRSGYSYLPYFDQPNRTFANLSLGFHIPDKLRLYGQVSCRLDSVPFQNPNNYATVAGIKFRKESRKIRLTAQLEGRHYAKGFNKGFINYNVAYRKPWQATNYANTVGKHFYPLLLYDRPFSQWSVFTEYQDSVAYHVSGISALVDFKLKIHEELTLIQQYDMNYIRASNGSEFLYPFYNIGLAWEPHEGNFISVSLTNKGMNLDLHYPTLYLYQRPTFMFRLQRDLPRKWFRGLEPEF